ncbi:MAG: ABC transporter permease [Gammaproteobacteria bacterium]|nr:ABC transporter permease [Gammaproteobacteria bacterium]
MFTIAWLHRGLIYQLTKREILTKYRGSFAGLFWALLSPLLMLSLYTVVFSIFMRARWAGAGLDNKLMYALLIYAGLINFNFFFECISRAPTLIVTNPGFVKKIIFPLEIYPWVLIGSALFQMIINTVILSLFCLLLLGKLYATILLLPILLIPFILVTLGMSWFLCSIGVYVRDINLAMTFIAQVTMYLSPIFYATTVLPQKLQQAILINPLTYIIEQTRNVVIFGQLPQWPGFFVYFTVSLCVAWLGFLWFQKTKSGFADVL